MNAKEYMTHFNRRRHIPARYYAYWIGAHARSHDLSQAEAVKRARECLPSADRRYIREGVADAYATSRED